MGLLAGVSVPSVADATVVFSEDFSTLSGTPISPSPNPTDSQRGTGTYLGSITLPGWNTVGATGVLGFDRGGNGSTGDRALLLNEDGTTSNGIWRTIGLVVGESYVLSFEYWGDNRVAPLTYSFTYEINGAIFTVNQTSPAVLPDTGFHPSTR